MAVKNATVLHQIWLEGTNDFQQRVPEPTQGNIAEVQKAIFSYKPSYNEFVDALINRVGKTYILSKRWENPLALFKRANLEYGETIQEVAVQLIKAKGYELDAQTLLEINRPESKCAYHSVNRQDKYPITINDVELRKAFVDEYGLNNYVAAVLSAQINSDNYDEYQIMKQLISEYENNHNGFFKVNVSAVSDAATAKALLKGIRTYLGKLKFLSALYNKAGYNGAFSNPDEMILITTPEVKASMDVDALAQLFHLEKAEVQTRIIEIDEFPIAGAQALLVDADWFLCGDYVYENNSFYNPETLSTQYFLHHWGVYSCSPFMNAVLFTTAAATNPATVSMTPSGFALSAKKNGQTYTEGTTTVTPDDVIEIIATLSGSVSPETEDVVVAPNAYVYTLAAQIPAKDDVPAVPVQISNRTYIDRKGILHIQKDIPAGAAITVSATCTYRDPSGRAAIASDIPYTDDIVINIAPES